MNKTALVTIVCGDTYQEKWNRYCKKSWVDYAKKYNYDLVVFDTPLDESDRAKSRSIAWQKCLVLDQPQVKQYERAIWVDSDIIINTELAPEITNGIPIDKIGATNEYAFYTEENYSFLYERYIKQWVKNGSNAIVNKTPNQYYRTFGIETDVNEVVQTGVMVLSPLHHNELLKHVYYNYEDKGASDWNYEMRPLSYEIVKNDLHYFINGRFNFLYNNFKNLFYAHLLETKPPIFKKKTLYHKLLNKLTKRANFKMQEQLAVQNAFDNAYFLHFAGCIHDLQYTNLDLD
ncbi:hypothetical protein GCM10023149_03490 [Mucilaginibacter gynuensis]|uniref:Glycosyl transferase family 8 n=1 Tax=Mucilaginibacter gynuensis TaxID=1302236 RepID=A0ABP8FQY4_9SPHI